MFNFGALKIKEFPMMKGGLPCRERKQHRGGRKGGSVPYLSAIVQRNKENKSDGNTQNRGDKFNRRRKIDKTFH
ncbi:MAG: hypothetical protein HAW59_01775 [Betaproteobacteria bacterium]|nr:hypothetical protein [Betaproteobacteria bacterium]